MVLLLAHAVRQLASQVGRGLSARVAICDLGRPLLQVRPILIRLDLLAQVEVLKQRDLVLLNRDT